MSVDSSEINWFSFKVSSATEISRRVTSEIVLGWELDMMLGIDTDFALTVQVRTARGIFGGAESS